MMKHTDEYLEELNRLCGKKMHQTGKIFSFILLGLGCLCLISGGILIGRQMSATPKAESSAPEEVPYEQAKNYGCRGYRRILL